MSKRKKFDPLAPPDRWMTCPRKSNEIIGHKFIAFKTPLSSKFDTNVPEEYRFNFEMLLKSLKNSHQKLGLVIDLTKTDRFYDPKEELEPNGIKHIKIQCSGHEQAPNEEQTQKFIAFVETYSSKHPKDLIGVHCTHGFNRTGFLICAYLVDKLDFGVDAAVAYFAQQRPPGIYKQDYIRELFRRYGSEDDMSNAPERPQWDNITNENGENEEINDDDGGSQSPQENSNGSEPTSKKRKREPIKENAEFAMQLANVQVVLDPEEVQQIRQLVQDLCKWDKPGFPGSQPVSMDCNNLRYLSQKKYMVSWKADGTRYLMFVYNGKVYMLDRDNAVFRVHNLKFLKCNDFNSNLESTLMDGEFVVDLDGDKKIPRFLIYDCISYEGHDVSKLPFAQRLSTIEHKIIKTRNDAIYKGKIDRAREPFGVRQKPFYHLSMTQKLLGEEFAKKITHGIDGLIFQPAGDDDSYVSGRCDFTLKWKPPTMNSVDFKLFIRTTHQYGTEEEIGELWVGGYSSCFAPIKVNKTLRKLNGKIIECKWGSNGWEFMRERTDKSYPNALKTAVAVCGSIKYPVDVNNLLSEIAKITKNDAEMMPPPLPPGLSLK